MIPAGLTTSQAILCAYAAGLLSRDDLVAWLRALARVRDDARQATPPAAAGEGRGDGHGAR